MHQESKHSLKSPYHVYLGIVYNNWLMLIILFSSIGVAWYLAEWHLQNKREEEFQHNAHELIHAISHKITTYEQILRNIAGLFSISGNITQQDWQTYITTVGLLDDYPNIHSIGHISLHNDGKNNDNNTPLQATELTQNRTRSKQSDAQYCFINYITPFNTVSAQIRGHDMCATPALRSAIERAIATGDITLSSLITPQHTTVATFKPEIVMFSPVYYHSRTTPNTEAQMPSLVFINIQLTNLLQKSLVDKFSEFQVAIFDDVESNPTKPFFSTSAFPINESPGFYQSTSVTVAGKQWRFNIFLHSQSIDNKDKEFNLLLQLSGMIFVLLLFYMGLMTARTRHQTSSLNAELNENEKRFQLVIEASPSALFITNHLGTVTFMNGQAEKLFGYKRDELLGKPINTLLPHNLRNAHSQHMLHYFAHPTAKNMSMRDDLFGVCKDGSKLAIEVGLTPINFNTGLSVLATINDISLRKNIEIQKEQHTRELERINQELDRFAYIASHDLKSPLKGIEQLATWLTEDLKNNTNEQVQNYLRLIQSRTNRMTLLLDGLLMFARVGRHNTLPEAVNSSLLIEEIFELVAPPTGFRLVLSEALPDFKTIKPLLELVIRNLISNAIKHHDHATGTITVSCRRTDELYLFSVLDDGPGIPNAYHDKVFDMFQTLKPRDEIEGSGIGLSLVKKTVVSLGGDIQLTSKGRGCCVTFSWPVHIDV